MYVKIEDFRQNFSKKKSDRVGGVTCQIFRCIDRVEWGNIHGIPAWPLFGAVDLSLTLISTTFFKEQNTEIEIG